MNAKQKEAVACYAFLSPWLLGFFIFTVGPLIASMIFSTWKWDLLTPPEYIGFDNYVTLWNDPDFWQSLKVTAIYSFARVPLVLILGLSLAALLNQKIKALGFFRTVYYVPTVLPGVAVSMLWVWILNDDYGILNAFLKSSFGIEGPNWLRDEFWVIPALIVMSLWGIGGNMLVYLAGLQGIPTEMYESATIDGANFWQKFINITIPMISPVIFYNLIISLIHSFETFTQAYVMTRGGPNGASLFYILYLYNNAFRYFNMGYASALAWIFFIVLMVFTALIFKSSKGWVYYEGNLKGR